MPRLDYILSSVPACARVLGCKGHGLTTTLQKDDRNLLFHGTLADAPGRNESWDEYLRYGGNNRWELIIEGTDFSGISAAESVKEVMSTKALVKWVQERDAEIKGTATGAIDGLEESDDKDAQRRFGPRAERLREIAVSVGAAYCVSCLDSWLAGSWPPEKRRAIRILDIKGVTRRGVWIRIFHSVYEVDTNVGPGFLYPPGADRSGKLILKSESSMAPGRMVKVPTALMAKIEALKSCFESLAKQ